MTQTNSINDYESARKYNLFSFANAPHKDYKPFHIDHANGIYVYDEKGKEYIDVSSQLVNVNIGFNNKNIIAAIQKQAERLAYIAPRHAFDEAGELSKLLIEEIAPKNMGKVLFTLGGSEANEFAIRFAKAFTGRDKILSKYESYHGSSYGASSLTGESDRASLFPTIPGFIKFPAPHLYGYDIKFKTEEEATKHFLARTEYQIQQEGPDTIAALFIESVTGSNGVYLYPKGYLKGLREITKKYGILLVCDEVMSGFLRSGDWFACQREDVEPDIITFAKGVNSAYAPLGGVLVSKEIGEYYAQNSFTAGLTYNTHPLGVAAALACIKEYKRLNVKEHVLELEPYLKQKLAELKAKHKSVGDVRSIGLFGAIEFSYSKDHKDVIRKNKNGEAFLGNLIPDLRNKYGLLTMGGGSTILVAPPLIITKEQIDEIFVRLHKAISEFADDLV
ncbi:MAG: aminotransferase class III-fold pyridoxal phosphate-dependent enzyme [Hallerella porci]|uniref:aminotransferase class III-fold pyridoxal phosphate-dependent enzyme n=1 Tax=Hallerella TaxID=2815788 RepID=UPI00258BBC42|nr:MULTISPECIES: aminotransferase class III-fold pyridoxal phosphate-dependent enzyme [Hallerella]MCI5601465.1 aminotransferase class III-fold pyridoxal phosphate-dependent enzyme [Hallerella sp.]MDY3922498.1 aminotransferase class III-fold pyridoxal phosphate-dependent enzyme [Hallerella porci]